MLNPPTRTLGLNSNKVKPLQSVFISTKAEHSTFDLLVLVRCSSTIYSLTTVPVLVSWSSGTWWLIAGLLLPGNGDLACLPSPHVLCGVNPPFFCGSKSPIFGSSHIIPTYRPVINPGNVEIPYFLILFIVKISKWTWLNYFIICFTLHFGRVSHNMVIPKMLHSFIYIIHIWESWEFPQW